MEGERSKVRGSKSMARPKKRQRPQGRRYRRRESYSRSQRKEAYCSPCSGSAQSESDEEWQPWMSPQQPIRKKKGGIYYYSYCYLIKHYTITDEVKLSPLNMATRIEMLREVDEEVVSVWSYN